jgi:hypothetical protein
MKRLYSVTVRKADNTNAVENVVTPGTGSVTAERRAAEDAVQAAYSGSEITSANYMCDLHREI